MRKKNLGQENIKNLLTAIDASPEEVVQTAEKIDYEKEQLKRENELLKSMLKDRLTENEKMLLRLFGDRQC